jgi:hypothetical protein
MDPGGSLPAQASPDTHKISYIPEGTKEIGGFNGKNERLRILIKPIQVVQNTSLCVQSDLLNSADSLHRKLFFIWR